MAKTVKKYKVAICRFPGTGSERHETTSWLMSLYRSLMKDPRVSGIHETVICDTPITMGRNRAVKECLAAKVDYIIMVDSDMHPDYLVGIHPDAKPFWPTAWKFLLERREMEEDCSFKLHGFGMTREEYDAWMWEHYPPLTVAAPYCGPPPEELPYIFKWRSVESDNPNDDHRLKMMDRETASERGGIEIVAALPTGLIAYDSRVFRKLPMPWFDYEWGDPERSIKASTEDVFQTRNASLLGMPQRVLWDCWAIHVKTKHVRKPYIITSDEVAEQMRLALSRGKQRGERVVFTEEPPGAPQRAT